MPTTPAPRVSGGIGTYARAARQQCADDHGSTFEHTIITDGDPGTIHTHDEFCRTPCYRDCDNAAFVWDLTYIDPATGRMWAATYALTLDHSQIVCWAD